MNGEENNEQNFGEGPEVQDLYELPMTPDRKAVVNQWRMDLLQWMGDYPEAAQKFLQMHHMYFKIIGDRRLARTYNRLGMGAKLIPNKEPRIRNRGRHRKRKYTKAVE